MTLLKHRRAAQDAKADTPCWSLTLPRWSEAPGVSAREAHPAAESAWTCARCGAVASDITTAREHINLHSLQDLPRRAHSPSSVGGRAVRGSRRTLSVVRGRARAAG